MSEKNRHTPEKYIDTVAASALTGLTVEGVNVAARSGRIPGAIRHGSVRRGAWLIPVNDSGGIDIIGRRNAYSPRKAAA